MIVAAMAAAVQGVAAPVGAQSAHGTAPAGPTPTGRAFSSGFDRVKTSTGVVLSFEVSATTSSADPRSDGTAVNVRTPAGTEHHTWVFAPATAVFQVSARGSGSIRTGARAGRYGVLNISFTAIGRARRTSGCDAATFTSVRTERLRGTVVFNTRSPGRHSWGTIGRVRRAFSFRSSGVLDTSYADGSCRSLPNGSCSSQLEWFADNPASVYFSGSTGGGLPKGITADRIVALSEPHGAVRVDAVYVRSSPPPKLTTRGRSAVLRVTTSGRLLHGSAVLRSVVGASPVKATCDRRTIEETRWAASLASRPSALRATEQIFGSITLPKRGAALFTRVQG